MSWVLLLVIFARDGVTSQTIEFNDGVRCIQEAKRLAEMFNDGALSKSVATCVKRKDVP